MDKLLFLLLIYLGMAFPLSAIVVDSIFTKQAAGKYYCYPYLHEVPPTLTPSPEGYEPFHMEHYGRHGSRWHIGYKYYDTTYDILKKADEDSQLTPLGKSVFKTISNIRQQAHEGRSGDLTDIGALQHRTISRRMVTDFPEIFVKEANIAARSSTVIRAILSMQNSLDGIRALCPEIKISTDASEADIWYIKYVDEEANGIRKSLQKSLLKEYKDRHINKGLFLKNLIKDPEYAKDSIGHKLATPLFYTLANCQSHVDQPWLLDSIFSKEEIWEQWLHDNADWFIQGGNSKLTNNRMPFSQSNLLMNIIMSADTTFFSHKPSINLRYGHDGVLLPLIVLMEINDFGKEINDIEDLAEAGWHDYLMVPMAANLQMIFYRRPDKIDADDILVKVLLNENEVILPTGHVAGPYYNWKILREYYLNKISPYISPALS